MDSKRKPSKSRRFFSCRLFNVKFSHPSTNSRWKDSETLWTYAVNHAAGRAAKSFANLATGKMEHGKFGEAKTHLEKALSMDASLPEAHNSLGVCQMMENDLDRAQGSFERAIASKPDYGEAMSNLATVLSERGNLQGAYDYVMKALQLTPNSEKINENLRHILSLMTH